MPTAETDINAAYEDAIHVLSTKPPKEEKKVDAATRKTFIATSGQGAQRFCPLSCRDCFLFVFLLFLRSVLMSWVLSNVGDFSAFPLH